LIVDLWPDMIGVLLAALTVDNRILALQTHTGCCWRRGCAANRFIVQRIMRDLYRLALSALPPPGVLSPTTSAAWLWVDLPDTLDT
jgi:hypothetical protein